MRQVLSEAVIGRERASPAVALAEAGVAELAYAQDLGSCGLVPCGFNSHRPHIFGFAKNSL